MMVMRWFFHFNSIIWIILSLKETYVNHDCRVEVNLNKYPDVTNMKRNVPLRYYSFIDKGS
jgi:hypothetical protein